MPTVEFYPRGSLVRVVKNHERLSVGAIIEVTEHPVAGSENIPQVGKGTLKTLVGGLNRKVGDLVYFCAEYVTHNDRKSRIGFLKKDNEELLARVKRIDESISRSLKYGSDSEEAAAIILEKMGETVTPEKLSKLAKIVEASLSVEED